MPSLIRFGIIIVVILNLASCRKAMHRFTEKEIVSVVGQLPLDSAQLQQRIDQIAPNAIIAQELLHIYQLNGFKSLWIETTGLNPLGTEMLDILHRAYVLGLNPNHYPTPTINHDELDDEQKVSDWDAQLTLSATLLVAHAAYGVVRSHDVFTNPDHAFFRFRAMDVLRNMMEGGSAINAIEKIEPQFVQYAKLREVATKIVIPLYKPNIYPYLHIGQHNSDLVKTLRWLGYKMDESEFAEYGSTMVIKSYQKQHQLPLTGTYDFATFAQMSRDCIAKYHLLNLNLERLRQNPPLLPNYVWVNIPSFKLDLVKGNQAIHSTRVVVGAPKTPTPILSSKLSHVITYPKWNIPTSIIQKEIIPAMAKDSNYLAKKGYKVSTWSGTNLPDNTVMKYSSAANHLPFNISQPPGNDNALGTLKFLFDNSESVYLHDTNSKSYFSRNFRALSHGCIRVQNPHYFATLLLDTASVARMDKQLARKQSGHIGIKGEIGVYLRYITCGADPYGNLVEYADVYRYDAADRQKMAEAMVYLKQ